MSEYTEDRRKFRLVLAAVQGLTATAAYTSPTIIANKAVAIANAVMERLEKEKTDELEKH